MRACLWVSGPFVLIKIVEQAHGGVVSMEGKEPRPRLSRFLCFTYKKYGPLAFLSAILLTLLLAVGALFLGSQLVGELANAGFLRLGLIGFFLLFFVALFLRRLKLLCGVSLRVLVVFVSGALLGGHVLGLSPTGRANLFGPLWPVRLVCHALMIPPRDGGWILAALGFALVVSGSPVNARVYVALRDHGVHLGEHVGEVRKYLVSDGPEKIIHALELMEISVNVAHEPFEKIVTPRFQRFVFSLKPDDAVQQFLIGLLVRKIGHTRLLKGHVTAKRLVYQLGLGVRRGVLIDPFQSGGFGLSP